MKYLIHVLILFYLLPLSVFANTKGIISNDVTKSNKTTLTVAIAEGGYYPFYYKEKDTLKGLSVDIINYIKVNSHFDFNFITLQWPRALDLVARGKVDLILTLFKTPKRKQIYYFIEPSYGSEINQLFSLTDTDIDFTGQLTQLAPYAIGTLREYSYGKAFDQAQYLKKRPALTEEVLLKLLLNKQIDMLIGNPFKFSRLINHEQLNTKVRAIMPYVAMTPVYMVLTKERKDSHTIKQTLEQLIQQLKSTPSYQELLDKYQLNFK
ncbi:amino acid ABC transporter substrate-binding protein [Thalassotalea insulae]|uniref:Amino acid ABC transporter substrate-binding protein n=1 Tax=Thalassotalea insulae TaxID=2056778 RepID=A0ABQ6GVU3_9GAMM|nr:transporter substrate-binding domain-containing protein [Thalassotalea insulae]GLX80048.1 amino acid ABC transporter substrate-binding protein [Thalassotalea insulae]